MLKRHLSDVIHRHVLRGLAAQGLLTGHRARRRPVKPQHPTAATTSTGLAAHAEPRTGGPPSGIDSFARGTR